MAHNFDWLQWQRTSGPAVVTDQTPNASPVDISREKALHHFRQVSHALEKYRYKALALSPKGEGPAPYYLHINRKQIVLNESTPHGAVQTRLELSDGSLWRDGKLADEAVFAHFVKMIERIQAKLRVHEIKIGTKREGDIRDE